MRRSRWSVLVPLLIWQGAACSDSDETSAPTESTATAPTSSSTVPATSPSTEAEAAFPPARTDLQHGAPAWAVVLAGAEEIGEPNLVAAETAAKQAGYFAGPTDCDQGAKEALGFPSDFQTIYTVSVYFDTQPAARLALAAFREKGLDGGVVAEVRTGCLD